jgi:hypothetical protein
VNGCMIIDMSFVVPNRLQCFRLRTCCDERPIRFAKQLVQRPVFSLALLRTVMGGLANVASLVRCSAANSTRSRRHRHVGQGKLVVPAEYGTTDPLMMLVWLDRVPKWKEKAS